MSTPASYCIEKGKGAPMTKKDYTRHPDYPFFRRVIESVKGSKIPGPYTLCEESFDKFLKDMGPIINDMVDSTTQRIIE